MQSEPYDVDPYSDVTYIQTEWDEAACATLAAPDDPPPLPGDAMNAMPTGPSAANPSPI